MPEAPILGGSETLTLDDAVFGAAWNGPLVHESVRHELAARRQGTASTKTRGQIRGGGAKPWRQKGTGRARAGSSRSPLWTGGGTIFGPSPRHHTFKVNRKEKRAALRSALSLHAGRGSLAILDGAPFDEPSTKKAAELLATWDGRTKVLLVLAESERRRSLSFRNLDRVAVLPAEALGVADVVRAGRLLLSRDAVSQLTTRSTGTATAGRRTEEEVA